MTFIKRTIARALPAIFAAALAPGVAIAQRALTQIPNPDPEYQQSLLDPAEGFEINLFASDPMIAKPTAMSFDGKGRLFVACTPIYPHILPGKMPSDQIIRLEDTNGDGRADKRTVFADGLLIPTAVLANPEGVYVCNSTELLFFTDEDDDGVADSRRILYSGFGTEDTHHIIHTLRNGPAGRIYFNQSVYTHSHVETPYGYRDLQAGGVWQFRPETLELEVYARGMWNSWGLQFDRWGQSFQSDGAGFEGLGYSFPGAAFVRAVGYDKYLSNLNPGQPKFSGLEIIDSPQFPEAWQGLLVTCDFRGNRISSFRLSDSNSGFISIKQKDLVTSTHGAFRPIDLQNGPDGALYVADWYNPIIQHGEVDFRDERRDHTHGRIWRITAKDRPLLKRIDFPSASLSVVLDSLKAGNAYDRDQAKRELKHRGAEVVLPALMQWVRDLDTGSARYEAYLREAVWVTQSLDQVNYQLLEKLLDSENFKARAMAVRVLEERPAQYEPIYSRMVKAVTDRAPRVRNEAIQVLRKLDTEEAAKLVVRVLDYPMDEILDFSLWNALRQMKDVWLPRAQEDPEFFGDNLEYLLFAIRSVEDPRAVEPLETLWKNRGIGAEYLPGAMELLAERGEATIMAALLDDVDLLTQPEHLVAVFKALESSSVNRSVQPAANQELVIPFLLHPDPAVQAAAATLLGKWKLESALEPIAELAAISNTDETVRTAAVGALVAMDSRRAREALAGLSGSDLPVSIRMAITSGYAQADPRAALPLVIKLLEGLDENSDGTPLVLPYLEKPELPGMLAKGLAGSTLNTQVGTLLLRRTSTATIDTTDLKNAIQEASGIEPVNQNLGPEEMRAMVDYVETHGDPVRGEAVYRRDNLLCMTCHAIGGAGGMLGPDLTSIGASAPVDYLIDSLLQPQKQIKEGFHVVMVTKKDGSVSAGKLVSENESTLTLQDGAGEMIDIPKSAVASREMSPISLMPPGLTLSLRKDEFADLVKFMSLLGKEGDFKVGPNRYVRTFRYLDDKDGDSGYADMVRHKPMVFVTGDDPRMIWLPAYARVNGHVPLEELPSLRRQGRENYHYLKFHLDAKTPGKTILSFNDSGELRLFVEGKEVENVSDRTTISLKPGINELVVAAHAWKREAKTLRIEILDAESSPAQVQIVTGP